MDIFSAHNLVVSDVVHRLEKGETLVYPTETCYGLGCDATNKDAIDRIYRIKQRDRGKPLLIIASSVDMLRSYVEWSPLVDQLAAMYWPGPLTVIMPVKHGTPLAAGVVSPEGMVACRVTTHPVAQALTIAFRKPIVSTSANISGGENVYTTSILLSLFENEAEQPDMLIDAGTLPERKPSTIVRVDGERLSLVRQGDLIVPNTFFS